jgi:hypothetical protein
MKRAIKVPQYADVSDFKAPAGVVTVQLDKVTNRLATPSCPEDYTVAFIAGTEPKDTCDQSYGDHRGFFTKIFGLGSPQVAAPPPDTNGPVPSAAGGPQGQTPGGEAAQAQPPKPKKKKGFLGRLFGKDSSDEEQDNGTNGAQNGNTNSPK